MMTLDRFEEALSLHGSRLERWPAALAAEATALVARDARAAALHTEAARLDARLADIVRAEPVTSAALGHIIVGIDNGHTHDVTLRPTPRFAAWAGVMMAAFLVVGFAIGLAVPADQNDDALAGLLFGTSVGDSMGSLL